MGEAYRMGLMHGQFDSTTKGERMELRVRRMIEWRSWWEKVLGRAWPPMRNERNPLRWPDVPEAGKERHCHGWGCTKKVPAGRLVCPWCGRMERPDDFSWMDVLAMPRETVDMGNGICKTVFRPTGRDGGTVLEQYTRMSAEALELKVELVTKVPVETVRALLEGLGVAGDS
jgi:hypothetical protein